MKKAIIRREFIPYSQAVVNQNGAVSGCEILMRWKYHTKLIRPDAFIPTAEQTGMIIPMTLNLIDDVYKLCKQSAQFFTDGFHLSINICPTQLSKAHSHQLVEHCRQFSEDPDLKHISLVLEVTERQIINHDQDTIDTIEELHKIGVGISIDDFGTGYSSLENIRDFQIDGIKIDKSFIDGFPHRALSGDIIDNMLDLANRLKIPVTAEGIETQTQANYLIERGVKHLQGYLYHKPEPLKSFLHNKKNK
ncbi:EAL domain-containing protein [Vibrio sp. S17_S38]|uniref:EAL domain-containing protein n=1 Tax=Vibrio sp. S17_S38 TaxID=2720229 RepID=UPI001EED095C|nr:EAL domain-containing protein [Vibrio sp. S17_S38]